MKAIWGIRACSGRSGFTLIELSIALVIIGLIVGNILTGYVITPAPNNTAPNSATC